MNDNNGNTTTIIINIFTYILTQVQSSIIKKIANNKHKQNKKSSSTTNIKKCALSFSLSEITVRPSVRSHQIIASSTKTAYILPQNLAGC